MGYNILAEPGGVATPSRDALLGLEEKEMLPFFEHLQEATVVKRFLDELEKNPRRTLGVLAVVLCLTGAGVKAVGERSAPPGALAELPTVPAQFAPDGTLEKLPEAKAAEEVLAQTLSRNERRHQAVMNEIRSRADDAEVTEREIQLLNDSGKVSH